MNCTNRGPYGGNPLDNKSGHTAGCVRLADEITEYEAAWEH